jgi:hypothetical protein
MTSFGDRFLVIWERFARGWRLLWEFPFPLTPKPVAVICTT